MNAYISSFISDPTMYNCLEFNQFLRLINSFKGPIAMDAFLKDAGYLDNNSKPTQEYLNMDMLRVVETNVTTSGKKTTYYNKVFVTKKGMLSIISRVLTHRINTEKRVY